MGQCLTLYQIAPADFAIVAEENSWQTMRRLAIADADIGQAFMALEFLLGKAGVPAALASAALYPPQVLAPNAAYETGEVALENDQTADALLAYFEERITFAPPETCEILWAQLRRVPVATMSNLYESRELRAAGIYPGIWHDDESPDQAFNRRYITETYTTLRSFYEAAAAAESYVLSLGPG